MEPSFKPSLTQLKLFAKNRVIGALLERPVDCVDGVPQRSFDADFHGGRSTDIRVAVHRGWPRIFSVIVSPFLCVYPVVRETRRRRFHGEIGESPRDFATIAFATPMASINLTHRLVPRND